MALEAEHSRPTVTVEVERKGVSLWVYQIIKTGEREEKLPLREMNWVFAGEQDWNMGVGAFVARETEGDGKDELKVEFGDGLEVGILEEYSK